MREKEGRKGGHCDFSTIFRSIVVEGLKLMIYVTAQATSNKLRGKMKNFSKKFQGGASLRHGID